MKQITVTKKDEGQTIYKFVKKYLNEAPLSFIEKVFRKKDVKIDGKRASKTDVVKEGNVVQIYVTDQQLQDFVKAKDDVLLNVKLDIVYEDENILIINKPSNLLVHGDENEKKYTLANQVLGYLASKGEYDPSDKTFIPGPAHRLDRNTSGLIIFGKNVKSLQALEDLFKDHENINKYYLALVAGTPSKEGTINKPLLKDEKKKLVRVDTLEHGAKTAITKYKLVERFSYCSMVEVELLTGRTHQIRVHMASIDHPLLGDAKYGNFSLNKKFENEFKYAHQFLVAYRLHFGELTGILSYLSGKTFTCSLPKVEKKIVETLRGK